ncbi:MAG: pilus assembly protein PilP, partial [Pseudomonadota bacterium]|nr:pilus assembly protein PilP [Pseudomonadota bacterium]
LTLAGCSNNDEMIALQDEVNRIVNRPPGPIDPPPEFVTYEAFTYSAASLRAPFDVPLDANALRASQQNNQVMPDLNRTPELLESFNIGNLVMVGTLARGGQRWALIRDETGNISRVGVGNYMGRNHGRIDAISERQIDVTEIVPTGDGGWIERPQTLTLQE